MLTVVRVVVVLFCASPVSLRACRGVVFTVEWTDRSLLLGFYGWLVGWLVVRWGGPTGLCCWGL